jgi:hypothetical protein
MLTRTIVEKYAPYGIWAFFVYFCYLYAAEISNGGNAWKTGDWLINYSGGPIRRGLTGTILLTAADFRLNLLWLTYFFQVSIYTTLFIVVLKLYKQTKRSLFWLLILYSPAFLLFPYHDINGGFRKEILVFAIFAFFCLIYAKKTITQTKLLFVSLIYVLAGLSHELTVSTLPFFLYLLYISAEEGLVKKSVATGYGAGLTIVSAAILLLATLYKGDTFTENVICQSLTNRGLDPKICSGSISFLSEDARYEMNRVSNSLINSKSVFTHFFLFMLTMLPLFFTTWWKKRTYVLFIVSTIAIFPLFLVATDWGRWIYILSFMLLCLALTENIIVKFPHKKIFVIAGMIYLTTWSIPHCCSSSLGKGLVGDVRYTYKSW